MSNALIKAVLLFHRGGPWTPNDAIEWERLTGSYDANTRTLCDLARRMKAMTDDAPDTFDMFATIRELRLKINNLNDNPLNEILLEMMELQRHTIILIEQLMTGDEDDE